MNPEHRAFFCQGLAAAVNLAMTGRRKRAMEIVSEIHKLCPALELSAPVMDHIMAPQLGLPVPDISGFMGEWWLGQSLEGKSIEVFCDEGMGDTINLLRYLEVLKSRWNCQIVLNCYAFFNEFERLMSNIPYVDRFVAFHEKCDFFTNIMSIPALVNDLKFEVYFPVHFAEILKTDIPTQTRPKLSGEKLDGHRIGIAWESNSSNPLSAVKSIPIELFELLDDEDWKLCSLLPCDPGELPEFVEFLEIKDLLDTARWIDSMDLVISVDTAVLHLAGLMHKRAYGLLPFDADPRWGAKHSTPWYPGTMLFRQQEDLDWSVPLAQIRQRLVSFDWIL